jgi:hypothetical protein
MLARDKISKADFEGACVAAGLSWQDAQWL